MTNYRGTQLSCIPILYPPTTIIQTFLFIENPALVEKSGRSTKRYSAVIVTQSESEWRLLTGDGRVWLRGDDYHLFPNESFTEVQKSLVGSIVLIARGSRRMG